MWGGIFIVGTVMAVGTLLVVDASLPGGLIEGSGGVAYAQTMAFTTLTLFQLFNVLNARSDERSAFDELFGNHWLWAAIALSLVLHVAVVYLPFLQQAFSTVSLSAADWVRCAAVASSVLWLRELTKVVARALTSVVTGSGLGRSRRVSEIVEEGVTGFIVEDEEKALAGISTKTCSKERRRIPGTSRRIGKTANGAGRSTDAPPREVSPKKLGGDFRSIRLPCPSRGARLDREGTFSTPERWQAGR